MGVVDVVCKLECVPTDEDFQVGLAQVGGGGRLGECVYQNSRGASASAYGVRLGGGWVQIGLPTFSRAEVCRSMRWHLPLRLERAAV